jgi:hypothetical protein
LEATSKIAEKSSWLVGFFGGCNMNNLFQAFDTIGLVWKPRQKLLDSSV